MKGKDYLPDNVFIHEFPLELGRIETPIMLLNLEPRYEIVVNAIWDTGATFSSIAPRIVGKLGLQKDGASISKGINGAVMSSTSLCFAFPGNRRYGAFVEASWLPDVDGVPDFIIGLDIIMMGDMRLQSRDGIGKLTFTFDTSRFIDYEHDDSVTLVRKTSAFYENMKRCRKAHGMK